MTKTLSAPIVVPEAVRRKAGLRPGDEIEFTVSGGAITISPTVKRDAGDGPTPAEARIVRRGEAQLKRGEKKSWREVKNALAR